MQRNLNLQNYCESFIARAKVDARVVVIKSPLVFVVSVTASLIHLGALLRDNLQMGAFS